MYDDGDGDETVTFTYGEWMVNDVNHFDEWMANGVNYFDKGHF